MPEDTVAVTGVLCVAGHDPSGGAGVLADAAVVRAFGLHPLTVLTGVAVQNSRAWGGRHEMSAAAVRAQLGVVSEEFSLGAAKIGMPGSAASVEALSVWLETRPRLPLVLDPVFTSTSGGELVDPNAEAVVASRLLPRATVVTPNIPEAARLSGVSISGRAQVPEAARLLLARGPRWVLIKGGHLSDHRADDYLAGPDGAEWLEADALSGGEVRGTGCALATALACGLAVGQSVPEAAREAKLAVAKARARAYAAGDGRFLDWSEGMGER